MAAQQPLTDSNGMTLFGFQIKRVADKLEPTSFVPEQDDNGGARIDVSVGSGAAYNSFSIDIDPSATKNEADLVKKYREISLVADIDIAIDEIVNEVVIYDEYKAPIAIDFAEDKAKQYSEKTKEVIKEEFDNILNMLNFNQNASDIVRTAYVDGRIAYHKVLNKDNPKTGIVELRPIDTAKLKRVIEIKKEKDPRTQVDIIKGQEEYFIYSEQGFSGNEKQGLKISKDAIAYATLGVIDKTTGMSLSFLHKAIRPMNQLRMMEDSEVIYRMVRAPQRRVFYIDTSGMARTKAEQYIKDVMARYKNKQVYDAATGTVKDEKKHLSILEDFWMPRACFSMDTKVKLLDGRDLSISDIAEELSLGKQNWAYSSSKDGKVVPGLISWAGVTKKQTKVLDVYLDNGEKITCTPEHKFMLRNGEYCEAQNLQDGSSLMPLYTENRNLYNTKDYNYVLDNSTGKWSSTHRMVKTYIDGDIDKKHVVHHVDLNRFNNNPENLMTMTKQDHLNLHTTLASKNWELASPEKRAIWCENLSKSGKEYFKTEAGIARSKEIAETNVKLGLAKNLAHKSNETRKKDKLELTEEQFYKKWVEPKYESRRMDKVILSEIDYYNKWVKPQKDRIENEIETLGVDKFIEKYNTAIKVHQSYLNKISKYDINLIISSISQKLTPIIKNDEIIEIVSSIYPELSTKKKFRKYLREIGYETISDFMVRNFENLGKRRTFQQKIEKKNHRVLKVVHREDLMDVGTLTIDEDNIYHDYHNYALSAGVFVKNSGGKGTEITNLEGGGTLSPIENVAYFQGKLYQSLNVPLSRLQAGQGTFNLGRENEISRDEIKFSKFIDKLRRKLNTLFLDILETQLLLKGIATSEDWEIIKGSLLFNYVEDNFYAELKESEMLKERMMNAQLADQFVGKYISKRKVMREIMRWTDDEITEIEKENEEDVMVAQKQEEEILAKYGVDPNAQPESK